MLCVLKACRLNSIYIYIYIEFCVLFLSYAKQTRTVTQTQVTNASALNFRMALMFVRNGAALYGIERY